jgi:FtsH-binding integral membrane protein
MMFTRFTNHFFQSVWHVKSVILVLIGLLVAGAAAVTVLEKMPFSDTLYFAFVTGLTIGYGDIVMKTPGGRLIALMIGLVGILFTGLLVAVLVYAVRESMAESQKRS